LTARREVCLGGDTLASPDTLALVSLLYTKHLIGYMTL